MVPASVINMRIHASDIIAQADILTYILHATESYCGELWAAWRLVGVHWSETVDRIGMHRANEYSCTVGKREGGIYMTSLNRLMTHRTAKCFFGVYVKQLRGKHHSRNLATRFYAGHRVLQQCLRNHGNFEGLEAYQVARERTRAGKRESQARYREIRHQELAAACDELGLQMSPWGDRLHKFVRALYRDYVAGRDHHSAAEIALRVWG